MALLWPTQTSSSWRLETAIFRLSNGDISIQWRRSDVTTPGQGRLYHVRTSTSANLYCQGRAGPNRAFLYRSTSEKKIHALNIRGSCVQILNRSVPLSPQFHEKFLWHIITATEYKREKTAVIFIAIVSSQTHVFCNQNPTMGIFRALSHLKIKYLKIITKILKSRKKHISCSFQTLFNSNATTFAVVNALAVLWIHQKCICGQRSDRTPRELIQRYPRPLAAHHFCL